MVYMVDSGELCDVLGGVLGSEQLCGFRAVLWLNSSYILGGVVFFGQLCDVLGGVVDSGQLFGVLGGVCSSG